MAKVKISLLTLLLTLLLPAISFATLFTSQTGGDWNNSATWDQGSSIPGSGDDVLIDGHTIFIQSAGVTINNLTITNNGSALSQLEIKDNYIVNIQGNLYLTAENSAQDIKLQIYENAIVNITGDMIMERTSDNIQTNSMAFLIYDDAQLIIDGAFDFYYRNSGSEAGLDIQANDNAIIIVGGKSTFQQDGGDYLSASFYGNAEITFLDSLDIILNNGKAIEIDINGLSNLNIDKSLTVTNVGGIEEIKIDPQTGGDLFIIEDLNLIAAINKNIEVKLVASIAPSILDVNGNIFIDAVSSGDIKLDIGFNSSVKLAGNLQRENKFGALAMTDFGGFYFDGSSTQTIPRNKYDEISDDSLKFTNVHFENTNGFILDGNVTIDTDLNLTEGIIRTTPDSALILENGVDISNASNISYIDGPLVKRGTHTGSTFSFPVGNNGMYAPIEIESIAEGVEYTATAIGCPPPLGVKNGMIKSINQELYWEIERADGLQLGEITLHWDDADAFGITDTASLVIAYYQNLTGWTSLGRKNADGNIGANNGSITIGCPPPLGVKLITFASTDDKENAAPLAVEMTNFRAYKSNDHTKVFLDWQTVSEENSNFFIVEKSYDGIVFKEIARVQAAQNSTTTRNYSSVDNNPEKGNNYYRIQEISQDQFMSFSSLVNVFFNGQEDIPIIYPNPVQNQVRVFSKDLENDEFFIKVLDINGKCIYTGTQRAQDGQLMLSTSTLNVKNPGIYFLSYNIGGEVKSLKFFKVTQ